MKHYKYLLLLVSTALTVSAFVKPSHKKDWTPLFNGKDLSGWDSYLGPPRDASGKTGAPIGLNNDPNHVFSIVSDNGEKVIRVSGENWGGISTKNEYADFHFQLMFKWGNLTWGTQKGKKKDSGLLYFAVGRQGADYGNWMRSQEFQIEEGNCGDYWGCAGAMEDIPATKKSDSEYIYDPSGQMYTFRETNDVGRHCIKRGDAENPTGEWNTLDLYCHGDTSVHVINGKVMMVLYHSQQEDNGKVSPLDKGKLQIQSEGAEVFYKGIKIKSLDAIPREFLK